MKGNRDTRLLSARVSMRQRDTDRHDKIAGGVILSTIDLAGAYVARKMCSQPGIVQKFVTRAMSRIDFQEPVLVGDVLSCYGSITRVGKTSVTIHIDVEADRRGEIIKVTEANLVFVAIGEDGLSQPLQCLNTLCPEQPAATGETKPLVPVASDVPPPRKLKSERILAAHRRMMPKDTNDMGNIFGGVLLSEMDEAGNYVASRICSKSYIDRCATRFMDGVEFKKAVHVGDVLMCYGTVTKIGRTSVTVHVDVEVDRAGEIIPVTHADIVYVALTKKGRPAAIRCARAQGKKAPVKKRKHAGCRSRSA